MLMDGKVGRRLTKNFGMASVVEVGVLVLAKQKNRA